MTEVRFVLICLGLVAFSPLSAAAPMTCRWTTKQQCDPDTACKPVANNVWAVADASNRRYARCDRNGCDGYDATVTVGPGAFTTFDLTGRGVFMKIGPAGKATEVVSLGNSVLISQGTCQ